MTNGEYIGAGSGTTKLLLHLNGNSTDSSGNSNNGTDTNITYVGGRFGQGAYTTSTTGKITCTGYNISGQGNLTLAGWIKPGAVQSGIWGGYFGFRNESNSDFYVQQLDNQALLECRFRNSSGTYYTLNPTIIPQQWQHIAFVLGNNTLSVYVNGNLHSSVPTSGTPGSNSIFTILRDVNNSKTLTYAYVDEVIIEARAWTPQEVAKYYTYAKGRFGII